MADIFEGNHRCYGYRRMQASLSKERVCISEKVVLRLLKQECLVVVTPKRRRYGSYPMGWTPHPYRHRWAKVEVSKQPLTNARRPP